MKSAHTCGILFMMLLLISFSPEALSQLNVGVGYFGETGLYPGAVIELEWEAIHSERFSTPFRSDLGFYAHPRSHQALFLDVHQGIGYDLHKDPEKRNLNWIRPKIFWQYPYNSLALHWGAMCLKQKTGMRVGYTHAL